MGSPRKNRKRIAAAPPQATPLTERQRQLLDFISQYTTERGYAPSMREMGAALGVDSTNGVNDHLKACVKKGVLLRDKRVARSYRVVK